ncbi:hypothetical protein A2U01_0034619, partial [Trifolium medium]|nr:hypothetical protein [Trifolium medium]
MLCLFWHFVCVYPGAVSSNGANTLEVENFSDKKWSTTCALRSAIGRVAQAKQATPKQGQVARRAVENSKGWNVTASCALRRRCGAAHRH